MDIKKNLEDMSIEELRKLHTECKEDLIMFQNDIKLLRQAYPGRLTMYEAMCQNPLRTDDIPEPTTLQDTNKIKDEQLLHHLALYSGVKVSEIYLNSMTIKENNGEHFNYTVKCSVEKINLQLSFFSNAKFTEDQFANMDDSYVLSDLMIHVLSKRYESELEKTTEYFMMEPAYLGAFFLCVQEYYRLFNIRRLVLKKLLVDNHDYIPVSLENETGHYVLECTGTRAGTMFFMLVWGLVFDLPSLSMRDSFKIKVLEDEQFVSDVNPLFNKLCSKDSELTEDEKLKLLTDVMVAVRAADSKDMSSTVLTDISQVQNTSYIEYPRDEASI